MSCQLLFLAVGNADCCIALPDSRRAVVIDVGHVGKLSDRLGTLDIEEIGSLYITHEHRDHMPTIVDFEAFVTQWIAQDNKIDRVRLPRGIIEKCCDRVDKLKSDASVGGPDAKKLEKYAQRIEDALRRLDDHERAAELMISVAENDGSQYVDGDMSVELLHPRLMFVEGRSPKPNEASVVLRLRYGEFAALLLGDLDGKGLQECLRLSDDRIRAHVVKIPHHGAWPAQSGRELEDLLRRIKPELAILSVGSTNSYKHVASQLFELLLHLNTENGLGFICTEVTRTCMFTASERQATNAAGLVVSKPCAGDITIDAQLDGTWVKRTETDHPSVVKAVPYAACDRRVDLGLVRSRDA